MLNKYFKRSILSLFLIALTGCCLMQPPIPDTHLERNREWMADEEEEEQKKSNLFEAETFTIYYTVAETDFDQIYIMEIERAVDKALSHTDACIEITGWADCLDDNPAIYEYNLKLATERIGWVKAELTARGINEHNITVEKGQVQTLPMNSSSKELDKWRKTEILVLPCLHSVSRERAIDRNNPFYYE